MMMSEIKHTPEKWRIAEYRRDEGEFKGDERVLVDIIIRGEKSNNPIASVISGILIPEGEAEANAQLITAAPDLLEACKCTLEEFKDIIPKTELVKRVGTITMMLRTAIAKAEKGEKDAA